LSFFTRFRRLLIQGRATAEGDLTADGRPEHLAGGDASGPPGDSPGDRPRWRRVAAPVITALAVLLVLLALIAPNQISRLTPGAFVRIPVEGLIGVALLLVLPATARRVVAAIVGAALGLLIIVKIADMGFFAALDRPFDPVLDWILLKDAVGFLQSSIGRVGAIGAMVGAAVLVVALLVFMTLAVLRLTRIAVRHRTTATRGVAVAGVAWVACAVVGVQIVPGVPVASGSAAALVYDRAVQAHAGLRDKQEFAAQAAVDAFHDTPRDQLLTGLRGKDVMLTFVESYGRSAIENPQIASQVDPALDDGNRRLQAAGFAARSAFLTSPVAGGGSWLPHATLLSGLWVNNQQRYNTVVSSDRLTLTKAFQHADWRTVAVMPGTIGSWSEGPFYGLDQVYASKDFGYRGPNFSWAPMPDQYALSTLEHTEHAKQDRSALMAEIVLVSSHAPWEPIPRLVNWGDLGDGSVFNSMAGKGDSPDAVLGRDPTQVRVDYGRSVAYSLNSLISYVETYGNDKLVLVFLGDHQPAPIVTGSGASRDVPITIVAHDRAVLDQISGWGWQDGLKPNPKAPVWRMDAFRDRFLTAFGPRAEPTQSPPPPAR
jgi:hypothetical protein